MAQRFVRLPPFLVVSGSGVVVGPAVGEGEADTAADHGTLVDAVLPSAAPDEPLASVDDATLRGAATAISDDGKWAQLTDASGVVYYFDTHTRRSSWQRPPDAVFIPTAAAATAAAPPPGTPGALTASVLPGPSVRGSGVDNVTHDGGKAPGGGPGSHLPPLTPTPPLVPPASPPPPGFCVFHPRTPPTSPPSPLPSSFSRQPPAPYATTASAGSCTTTTSPSPSGTGSCRSPPDSSMAMARTVAALTSVGVVPRVPPSPPLAAHPGAGVPVLTSPQFNPDDMAQVHQYLRSTLGSWPPQAALPAFDGPPAVAGSAPPATTIQGRVSGATPTTPKATPPGAGRAHAFHVNGDTHRRDSGGHVAGGTAMRFPKLAAATAMAFTPTPRAGDGHRVDGGSVAGSANDEDGGVGPVGGASAAIGYYVLSDPHWQEAVDRAPTNAPVSATLQRLLRMNAPALASDAHPGPGFMAAPPRHRTSMGGALQAGREAHGPGLEAWVGASLQPVGAPSKDSVATSSDGPDHLRPGTLHADRAGGAVVHDRVRPTAFDMLHAVASSLSGTAAPATAPVAAALPPPYADAADAMAMARAQERCHELLEAAVALSEAPGGGVHSPSQQLLRLADAMAADLAIATAAPTGVSEGTSKLADAAACTDADATPADGVVEGDDVGPSTASPPSTATTTNASQSGNKWLARFLPPSHGSTEAPVAGGDVEEGTVRSSPLTPSSMPSTPGAMPAALGGLPGGRPATPPRPRSYDLIPQPTTPDRAGLHQAIASTIAGHGRVPGAHTSTPAGGAPAPVAMRSPLPSLHQLLTAPSFSALAPSSFAIHLAADTIPSSAWRGSSAPAATSAILPPSDPTHHTVQAAPTPAPAATVVEPAWAVAGYEDDGLLWPVTKGVPAEREVGASVPPPPPRPSSPYLKPQAVVASGVGGSVSPPSGTGRSTPAPAPAPAPRLPTSQVPEWVRSRIASTLTTRLPVATPSTSINSGEEGGRQAQAHTTP